jgi:hypothetical protein
VVKVKINSPEIIIVNGKPQIVCQICRVWYRIDSPHVLEEATPKLFKYNNVPFYAHKKCFEKLLKEMVK